MRTPGWSFLKAWFLEGCLLTSLQVNISQWHHNSHNHIKACSLQICSSKRGIFNLVMSPVHPVFNEYYRNKGHFLKMYNFKSLQMLVRIRFKLKTIAIPPINSECVYLMDLLRPCWRDLIFRLAQSILSNTLYLRFSEIQHHVLCWKSIWNVFKASLFSVIILFCAVSALASSVTRG